MEELILTDRTGKEYVFDPRRVFTPSNMIAGATLAIFFGYVLGQITGRSHVSCTQTSGVVYDINGEEVDATVRDDSTVSNASGGV